MKNENAPVTGRENCTADTCNSTAPRERQSITMSVLLPFKKDKAVTKHSGRNLRIRPRIKAAIVRLALWGVLPVIVAEWLIQRGGLRHV